MSKKIRDLFFVVVPNELPRTYNDEREALDAFKTTPDAIRVVKDTEALVRTGHNVHWTNSGSPGTRTLVERINGRERWSV